MIEKGRTLVNDDERVRAYKDVQKYLADKMYTVGGFLHGAETVMVQPWVHDYYQNAMEPVLGPLLVGAWLAREAKGPEDSAAKTVLGMASS
jgi:ABC-type transport system substrate-binding protein